MQALVGHALLGAWEAGQGRHPVDQALVMLAAATRGAAWEQLAGLTVGQRDNLLLQLYQMTFSDRLDILAACPQCGERLEFSLKVADIRLQAAPEEPEPKYQFESGDYRVNFRLPDSFDLAALACEDHGVGDIQRARNLLLQRCVLEVTHKGRTLNVTALPEQFIGALATHMASCDPQADVEFNLSCPACAHAWAAPFDIAAFLWARLSAAASRLLSEIHLLARAYSWSEADILALSPARRRFYLERIAQ